MTVLLAMIAFASVATMAELALVVTAPLLVVWIAGLLPVVFWGILLREVHHFLRDGEPQTTTTPSPSSNDQSATSTHASRRATRAEQRNRCTRH